MDKEQAVSEALNEIRQMVDKVTALMDAQHPAAPSPVATEVAWTPWRTNPFAAIAEVATPADMLQVVGVVLGSISWWKNINADTYLDDLLVNIMDETEIMVERNGEASYRAKKDAF